MNEKTWLALFDTIRFAITNVVPILTAIGMLMTGYYAYKAKVSADANKKHLTSQDASLDAIDRKVDGQMTAFTDATKQNSDSLARVVKDGSDMTIDSLKAEIARLHAVIEDHRS